MLSLSAAKYISQRDLQSVLYELFPGKDIFQNTRRKSNIVSPITGYYLELDFWIPDLKLAFEFQDQHHYISLHSNATLEEIQQRDDIKKLQISERGENLVLVPYWWDRSANSLIATIRLQRNDLFPVDVGQPIPEEPPDGSYIKPKSVPFVGQLMLASSNTNSKFDPNSWWMGEKYNGIRVCWMPKTKKLYSRIGSEVSIPSSFEVLFTDIFLDGEIWFGRDNGAESQQLIARKFEKEREEISWNFLRTIVFDCPDKSGDENYVFEQAQERIVQYILPDHPFIIQVPYMLCHGKNHAKRMTQEIVRDLGEGVVLRQPKSPYYHGRATSLVKIQIRDDQEGLVVALEETECVVLTTDGNTLSIPFDNKVEEIIGNLQLGDLVTFTFTNFSASSGMPVEPKLLMMRHDVTWADVLVGDGRPSEKDLEEIPELHTTEGKRAPFGHWTKTDGENIRKFFEDFAKTKNFDPLVPSNWYSLTTEDVESSGGSTILKYYGWSVAKLLLDLFPNIGLDLAKFDTKPRSYWSDPVNFRKFFDSIATKQGFDPRNPENWYSLEYSSLLTEKGALTVLGHYKNSITYALQEVYPDIGLDSTKFSPSSRKFWNVNNKRYFFNDFAKKSGFDPRVAQNWYSVPESSFLENSGVKTMVAVCYGGSIPEALIDLYPDLNLDKSKFSFGKKKR